MNQGADEDLEQAEARFQTLLDADGDFAANATLAADQTWSNIAHALGFNPNDGLLYTAHSIAAITAGLLEKVELTDELVSFFAANHDNALSVVTRLSGAILAFREIDPVFPIVTALDGTPATHANTDAAQKSIAATTKRLLDGARRRDAAIAAAQAT